MLCGHNDNVSNAELQVILRDDLDYCLVRIHTPQKKHTTPSMRYLDTTLWKSEEYVCEH